MSDDNKPSIRQVIGSVMASFIGVQSNRNRERDFQHGRPIHYIIAGLAMTLLFVLVVIGVVHVVLSTAGVQ